MRSQNDTAITFTKLSVRYNNGEKTSFQGICQIYIESLDYIDLLRNQKIRAVQMHGIN